MRERPPEPDLDPATRERLESFSLDPGDASAFRGLEEELFLAGSFSKLAGMYDCRLAVLPVGADEWRDLSLRLAEIYGERLGDPFRARAHYERLLQERPQDVEALACLRRLHVRAGSLTQALQISEIEEQLPLDPGPRAALLSETGSLWLQVGEIPEAEERFRTALTLDPGCEPALAGLAALAQARGELDRAVQLHEQRLARLAGTARAAALEQLVDLLPASASDRARLYLRDAVRADPRRRGALERLLVLERNGGDSERLDTLRSALWKLAQDGGDRLRIAREGAREQLASDSIERARRWLERAEPYGPEDPQLGELRVAIYRRAGDATRLLEALEGQTQLGEPVDGTRLLELAVLEERQSRPERALPWAEQALAREPEDPAVLAVVGRLLGRLGRHTERAEILERRIRIEAEGSAREALLTELGDLYSGELSDPERAASAYRRAVHENPTADAAFERLADLLHKRERLEALDELLSERAASSVDPERAAELWCRVGELRLGSPVRVGAPSPGGPEDREGARRAFQTALEIDPTSRRALTGLHASAEAISDPQVRLEVCELELAMDLTEGRRRELLRLRATLAEESSDPSVALRAAEDWLEREPVPEARGAGARRAGRGGAAARERRALAALVEVEPMAPGARAAALRRLGDLALESARVGSLEEAAQRYRQALETCPDPELRRRLIDLYRQLGRLPDLVEALRAALGACTPEEALRLRQELAEVEVEAGDPTAGVETLWEGVRRDPLWGPGARRLEQLLDEQGLSEDRAELLSLQLERERRPDERRALLTRLSSLLLDEHGRAAEAAERAKELASPDRFEPLEEVYERALEAAGKSSELLRWLTQREPRLPAAERHPQRLRLARIEAEQGRLGEALDTLRRAERGASEEEREEIWHRRWAVVARAEDPRERDRLLGRLLEQVTGDQERSHVHLERARLRAGTLGDPRAAMAELDRAASLSRLDPGGLRLLAQVAGEAGRDLRRASALEGLVEVTRDLSERAALRLEIARLCADPAGPRDLSRAESQLRLAQREAPADRRVLGALAHLLEQRGDRSGLAALLREWLASPDLDSGEKAEIGLRLASIAREPHERASARRALEEAIAEQPDLPGPPDALHALLALDDPPACEALCAEALTSARAVERGERELWATRWLAALSRLRLDAPEELRRIEALGGPAHEVPALIERRIRLHAHAQPGPDRDRALAHALEERLDLEPAARDARRDLWIRQLVPLLAGPLGEPHRAMERLESEALEGAPLAGESARLAADLARELGDEVRERRYLQRLADTRSASPEHERRLGLLAALSGDDREAAARLEGALRRDPCDLEALDALEIVARRLGDSRALSRALELRYPLAPEPQRKALVVEGQAIAGTLGDAAGRLRWLRRAAPLESPPLELLRARPELELAFGDSAMALQALEVLAASETDPMDRRDALARAARIHEGRGAFERARRLYALALTSPSGEARSAPLGWIEAQIRLLERLGLDSERATLLEQLELHPEVSAERRASARDERLALLCRIPELRDRAARALSSELAGPLSDRDRARRLEQLLRVHEARGSVLEWCDTADPLLRLEDPGIGPERVHALEKQLARRLELEVGDLERARAAWERIDARVDDDPEVLSALERLSRDPGRATARAELLERLAARDEASPESWLEAASLRGDSLGETERALADVERALSIAPESLEAHRLRARICRRAGLRAPERESLLRLAHGPDRGAFGPRLALRLAELLAADPPGRDAAERSARIALARADLPAEDAAFPMALAAVLERLGSFALAIEVHRERLVALEPTACAPALREIARLAWDGLEDVALTRDALEALSGIEALGAEDLERLAAALEADGEPRGALELRRSQLEAEGDSATSEAWRALARDARALGDRQGTLRACDEVLRRDRSDSEALSLRAWVHREQGDARAELQDRIALGARGTHGSDAARELVRAAILARDELHDSAQATQLFGEALAHDPKSLAALLGYGELALERGEWPAAERCLGRACDPLRASLEDDAGDAAEGRCRLARVACSAARAARELDHPELELRHLETALDAGAADEETLEATARVALRLGALARAREAIEGRLARPDLTGKTRAQWLQRLAQALGGLGNEAGALAALEEAADQVPGDEITLARLVELCETRGDRERALHHLDRWCGSAPEECRSELILRAARLEVALGRRSQARARLEASLGSDSGSSEARALLAELELADLGPTAALARIRGAAAQEGLGSDRASLLWIEARANEALGESGEAARLAIATLELEPAHIEAARMLARQLGHAPDFAAAVRLLEDHLDTAHAPAHVEAELAEAIGRSYAGPLEDLDRARSAFRRALECNPARSRVREALADVTSFHPDSHFESLRLHRELLEASCTRIASWEALLRIALQWHRSPVERSCRAVLAVLTGQPPDPLASSSEGPGVARTDCVAGVEIESANRLLSELHEPHALPELSTDPRVEALPAPLRESLVQLAGPLGLADDAGLRQIFRAAPRESAPLPRRLRRRIRRARSAQAQTALEDLDPEVWRSHALAQAASRAFVSGALSLRAAIEALLQSECAGRSEVSRSELGDPVARIPQSRAARALLLRIADGCAGALGG
ncbi:MAG: tetratricopeptide repeat protein [Myxococcota bacterium]